MKLQIQIKSAAPDYKNICIGAVGESISFSAYAEIWWRRADMTEPKCELNGFNGWRVEEELEAIKKIAWAAKSILDAWKRMPPWEEMWSFSLGMFEEIASRE